MVEVEAAVSGEGEQSPFTYSVEKNPKPVASKHPAIVDLVTDDLQKRKEFGIKKYGVPLQAHNGRNPLLDLYEELIDAVLYLRQCLEEQADRDSE